MSRLRTTTLWAVAVLGALPAPAAGHSAFVGSTPQPGQRLEQAPPSLELRFTEPINRSLTDVALRREGSAGDRRVRLRFTGPTRLALEPGDLPTGAYRLEWRTVSTEDGHPLRGTFSFGIRAAAGSSAPVVEQSPFASGGWVRITSRIALYTFALLLAAALLLPRLLGREWFDGPGGVARGRQRAVTETLAWAAAGAAAAATLADAFVAAGTLAPAALAGFLLTNTAGLARLAVVVCFAAAAFLWRRAASSAALLVLLGLAGIAASGHAGSAGARVPAILVDWLHLVSVALWLGGIGLFAVIWAVPLRRAPAELRRAVARDVLAPFGRVALPAFALVVATGILSLVTQLGSLSDLWRTPYGRLLSAKVVLVAVLAATSCWHALRLRPRMLGPAGVPPAVERRHWRLVGREPAVGLGIVVLVAVLAAFPLPPRQLGDAEQARASAPPCDPCPLPAARAGELPVAAAAGSVTVAAWVRRTDSAVSGTLRLIDMRGIPSAAPVAVRRGSTRGCGLGCWRFEAPAGARLPVVVTDGGRQYTAVLPTIWRAGESARARALLGRAQATMRALRSFRQVEEVSSGPGSYARTRFRLAAPDRMSLRTDRGVRRVVVGRWQWSRVGPEPWVREPYGEGLAFRTRSWFRWEVSARAARLLEVRSRDGRPVATLALFEQGTPVWFRLRVDVRSGRVLEERMIARAHFMRSIYRDFNADAAISAPARSTG